LKPVLTVRTRVAIAYTLVFGVVFTAFAYLVYRNSREASMAKLDASILMYAGKIASEVEEQRNEHLFPVSGEFRSLSPGDLTGQRFLVRSLDGRVVIDDSVLAGVPYASARSVQGADETFGICGLGGENFRVYTGPVEVNDSAAYTLSVAASMAPVEADLEKLRLLFWLAIPAVLVVASIGAYVITRAAFLPVSSMIATARRISSDNLGSRLRLPDSRDEVRLLGETLNGMMDRIENAFSAQRQFIADAAHEIRTPLTIIRSDLELLRKRAKSSSKTREIGAIMAEVDRLARMAENLLLLSRLDAAPTSLENEPVRIDEVIVQCVRDMNPLFRKKGVVLGLHIGEAMEIRGDMEGMKRIVLNLLENSLKFTKRGGRVSVSLGNEPGAEMPVVVTVQDTGCGIAPRDLPRIFGRFFRAGETRGAGGGSGLGLAIVEHLVKLHRGIISVESEPGKGTTFALRFPVL
jgi:signal transduction histidine kinase